MTDDKTRHAGMADDNGAMGNADDERLLMMLGEALGDKPGDEETQAAWRRFEARHGAVRRRGMALRRAAMVLSAAAAVAVVLWLWPWSKPGNRDGIIETFATVQLPAQTIRTTNGGHVAVHTPAATTTPVALPDGTQVVLGSGSRLEYNSDFGHNGVREVTLYGEARFSVAHDARKPFIVKSDNMSTRVLGTVFYVRSYRGGAGSVVLVEGSVSVGGGKADGGMTLRPGQRAVVDRDGGIKVSKADMAAAGGWTQGEFRFDDSRLDEVMNDIGSWYNVGIAFHSPRLLKLRVHFNFPRRLPLDDVLQALNDLGVARFKYSEGRIDIE